MPNLREVFPTDAAVLELEPEELAGFLLEQYGHEDKGLEPSASLTRHNFAEGLRREYHFGESAVFAFLEAWEWLVREGIFVERSNGWYFVSRRGQRLKGQKGLELFRQANILPKASLHPVIAEKVWPTFLRGDYDVAVFQAFKEVEVAVREVAVMAPTDLGKDLMAKAFHATTGPLADPTIPEGERQATQLLFMGAIGSFKNPSSHRHVGLSDPHQAAEIIGFASLLMRVVDSRRTGPPP